ncbi:MFS transporter [Chloroflexota bacterium]
MSIFRFLNPKPTISDGDIKSGLRWMTWEGAVSNGFSSITTSGILAAFALALGANNLQIGILAAIPFLMQPLQIPTIFLVDKLKKRKAIATVCWLFAQLVWFPIALIPLYIKTPGSGAISMLLLLMAIRNIFGAICNCAWNPWIRDLIPQKILGSYSARRLTVSTAVAIVFGLGAAFFVEFWKGQTVGDQAIYGYTYVLVFGALFLGMASPIFMSLMPEPLMQSTPGENPSLVKTLTTPLRNSNFRKLMQFQLLWNFAANLAIPFFAVYMLQRLGLPLFWVIGLSVISQLFNILFLRVWGPFADRFGSKVILSMGVSLYLIVFLGWIFTTMPERYFLTIPLLIILHVFAGIATAAVSFTIGTLNLKLAPQGQTTPYLASASLAANIGGGLGPLVGGILADFFSQRQLMVVFYWFDKAQTIELPAFSMGSYDFLFAITFILGLITLSTLSLVREEGEVGREVVLESLTSPIRELSQQGSSVPSFNVLRDIPLGNLRRLPVPGLDVVIGVTSYQIADIAKSIASANIRARRIGQGLEQAFIQGFSRFWKTGKETEGYSIEITASIARGAMHAGDEKHEKLENLITSIADSIIRAASGAGIDPEDAIIGTSQGIIQGAVEIKADIGEAVQHTIETAREIAARTNLPEERAVAKAIEGMEQAADGIGKEVATQVRDYIKTY